MSVSKVEYDRLHHQVQKIQNNMDYNIKLILEVEEEDQRADKSGKCNIKIINKYGVPVEVFYKNPGARPKHYKNKGKDKLEVGGTINISTYQGVSWGVKIPNLRYSGPRERYALEVIKYNFKNNILTIYNTKNEMREFFPCSKCHIFTGLLVDVLKHEMTCKGAATEKEATQEPEPEPEQEKSLRLSPASDQSIGKAGKSAKRKKSIKKKKKRSKRKNKRGSKKR